MQIHHKLRMPPSESSRPVPMHVAVFFYILLDSDWLEVVT